MLEGISLLTETLLGAEVEQAKLESKIFVTGMVRSVKIIVDISAGSKQLFLKDVLMKYHRKLARRG